LLQSASAFVIGLRKVAVFLHEMALYIVALSLLLSGFNNSY